jgi:predicted transcriptional regulator
MLKELRTQHRTIIQMAFNGYRNKDIAERMEMSDCTVSQIIRSPLGQAYLKGMQDKAQEATLDVRKKLITLNASALNVLERVMNPAEKAPHSVQLTAAKDVLDRSGYKAPDRLHVDMTLQTKTDQEIDAEINAMQQSIAKTYTQSPNQVATITTLPQSQLSNHPNIAQNEFDPFTDEHQDEGLETGQATEIDPDLAYLNDTFEFPEESQFSEESLLLSKIPANIFQSN